MPRNLSAELSTLSVVSIDARAARLSPPDSLSAPERELFLRIVGTNKPAHFQPSDTPLMCRYVEAVIMAERAAEELRQNPVVNGKASPWLVIQEKNVRAMTSRYAIALVAAGASSERSDAAGTIRTKSVVKPEQERRADFFAAMQRFNALGALLPKSESLDAADAAGRSPKPK